MDLEQATETINILYFIIRNDRSGQALIQTLAKKAREGGGVRLVYDDGGSFMTPMSFFKPLVEAGRIVVKHYPAKMKIFTLNWNYRNHRRIVVIDGKVGYMGGMNIGDEGEMVFLLQMRFLKDYFMVLEDEKEIKIIEKELDLYFSPVTCEKKTAVQIVSDGLDHKTDHIRAAYIKLIMSAQDSILIQSPYFIPDSECLHVLKIASYSGVDIKIMLPIIPDNHFVHRTTTSYIKEWFEAGVEVDFYEGFLSLKIIVVDPQICTIGSVNMDVRSFSINFEISAFV